MPGYRLHPLKGDLKGLWSVPISGNWRIVFRFADGDAFDVDLLEHKKGPTMPMKNPPHPGHSIKDACLEPLGLSVTEGAKVLGVARHTLSRVINGQAGISPEMAIRLEKAGWSNADQWMRVQSAYDLAQARRNEGEIKVRRYESQPVA